MSKILKVLLVVILVCALIGGIGYFFKNSEDVELDLGNYTINEINLVDINNPNDFTFHNDDLGVKLLPDNRFSLSKGWGFWYEGMYEIKDNLLICRATILEWDGGGGPGSKASDEVFYFEIINENKLKLNNVESKDELEFPSYMLGMTYSKKIKEINKEYSSIDDNYSQEELEDLYNKNQAIEDTIYRKNYDIDNDGNLDLIEVIVKMNVKYVSELPNGYQYSVVGYDGGIDECIIKINGTTKNLGVMNPIHDIELIKENDIAKLKIEASYRANENTYYIGYNSNEIKVEIKV